jgi:hypothetical protein
MFLLFFTLPVGMNMDRNTFVLTWQGFDVKVPDPIIVDWADPEILTSTKSEKVIFANAKALLS